MTELMIDNDEESPTTASSMLSTAREALGLTQDEVAAQLYLTPSYIRIIDEDQLDKLPKPAFVRGYLRSYAKLVKLDGDEVVRQFETQNAEAVTQTIEIRSTRKLDPVNFAGPVFQTGIIGLVILALIIASVWWFATASETPPMTVSQHNPDKEGPEVLQLPERTALDDAVADAPAAGSPAAGLIDGVGEGGQRPMVAGELVSISTETIDAINYIRVDAGGDDQLKFIFTGDCWLEVEDGNGIAIFGDLGRAGDEIVVYGEAPFNLLFGKAPVVSMQFNGNDVDLRSLTSTDETAKVTVGGG